MTDEPIDEDLTTAEADTRIGSDEGDDLPVSPPDRQPRDYTGDDEPDSIETRITQEEPDPDSSYGAPEDEGGLDRRGDREDLPEDTAADEVLETGVDPGEASPEEAALHVAEETPADGDI